MTDTRRWKIWQHDCTTGDVILDGKRGNRRLPAAVRSPDTGHTLDASLEVYQEVGICIAFGCMPHRRVPGPPAVEMVAPRDRVVPAHPASRIGRLVHRGKDVHSLSWVRSEVVPLVRPLPARRERGGRWVASVLDPNYRRLHRRVASEVGADQLPVPGPAILGDAGGMHSGET